MHPIDELAEPLLYIMLLAFGLLMLYGLLCSLVRTVRSNCLHFWRWRHPNLFGKSMCYQCSRRHSFRLWV